MGISAKRKKPPHQTRFFNPKTAPLWHDIETPSGASEEEQLLISRQNCDGYLRALHELFQILPEDESLATLLSRLSEKDLEEFSSRIPRDTQRALVSDPMAFRSRRKQLYPLGDWDVWVGLAGRGWGKTWMGTNFVRERIKRGDKLIHIVTRTAADYRDVVVNGDSGIIASYLGADPPSFHPSTRSVNWPNGAKAICFSAETPGQLRGVQCHSAYADEIAAWRYLHEAWNMLMLGVRLGNDTRVCVTTTPRPLEFLRDLIADPRNVVIRGHTLENRHNLSPKFLAKVMRDYSGTRLGEQELAGEILNSADGALWSSTEIDGCRASRDAPEARLLTQKTISVDPSVKNGPDSAECGIVAGGLYGQTVYITHDASMRGPPKVWARRVAELQEEIGATHIIAEGNQGGEMVRDTLQALMPHCHVELMYSTEGKRARAEPVSVLYTKNIVKHVGKFIRLEDQMCNWVPGETTQSPDRLDALVQLVGFLSRQTFYGRFEPTLAGRREQSSIWSPFGLNRQREPSFKRTPYKPR